MARHTNLSLQIIGLVAGLVGSIFLAIPMLHSASNRYQESAWTTTPGPHKRDENWERQKKAHMCAKVGIILIAVSFLLQLAAILL